MSIDAAALAESLRRLATTGQDNDGVVAALEQVLDAAVALFDVDGAGVLVADEQDVLRYVAASDGPGRLLEQSEAAAGQGQCCQRAHCRDPARNGEIAGVFQQRPEMLVPEPMLHMRARLSEPAITVA